MNEPLDIAAVNAIRIVLSLWGAGYVLIRDPAGFLRIVAL